MAIYKASECRRGMEDLAECYERQEGFASRVQQRGCPAALSNTGLLNTADDFSFGRKRWSLIDWGK